MPDYLVLFVAGEAHDAHADALRDAARAVPGAGFFDEAADAPDRTVGVFLALEGLASGLALIEHAAAVSARLQARLEVQWREEILGWIDAGAPDAALAAACAAARVIPEPL